jgi:hypothetical protein
MAEFIDRCETTKKAEKVGKNLHKFAIFFRLVVHNVSCWWHPAKICNFSSWWKSIRISFWIFWSLQLPRATMSSFNVETFLLHSDLWQSGRENQTKDDGNFEELISIFPQTMRRASPLFKLKISFRWRWQKCTCWSSPDIMFPLKVPPTPTARHFSSDF